MMLNKKFYILLAILVLGAFSLGACRSPIEDENETQEEMDFSDEVEEEAAEEDGFEFSEDDLDQDQEETAEEDEGMEFGPADIEEFDEQDCEEAEYIGAVPCGTYSVDTTEGFMECPAGTVDLGDDPPDGLIKFVPLNDDILEIYAEAPDAAKGTLFLVDTGIEGSIYAGVLTNAEGLEINYSFFIDLADEITGDLKLAVYNPDMGGDCTLIRNFYAFKGS